MSLRYNLFCVDAFADRIGQGNPAGVCLPERPADMAWMQAIAREMNLSETAFISSEGAGFGLRWFTPRTEVDLCGHPTLATAHILRETGYLKEDEPARFFTKSGTLSAVKKGALSKSFVINHNALLGSAPAARASPGCESAILPVHNRGEISCTGNTEASQCAPAPNGGRAGARGVIITIKRGFLQSKIFN
jgi:hypothetical protein